MPEVGIGFFPMSGRRGSCLGCLRWCPFALTGLRADAGGAALALGLAQTFVRSAAFEALAQALEGDQPVEAVLAVLLLPSALMSHI